MSTPNPYLHPNSSQLMRLYVTRATSSRFLAHFSPTLLLFLLARACAPAFALQDHAFAGIGAGAVAVLCMNTLDLLKVRLQVLTCGPEGGIGCGIWRALRDIHASERWRGLYRGLGPNVAGITSSWGLYFLFYN
ncbi:mitochondrial carrier domain-containing protein [Russula dissimulans]|nr:mitochondrial carrier domain-containing protein [Russula dissimulans]